MPCHEGLSFEVIKDLLLFTLLIAPPFCNLSFYYNLDEVPGVAHGILKID